MVKPETGGEETGASIRRASRGGWGQRAGKDSSRNLGDPVVWKRKRDRRFAGIHNRERDTGRESERPIVAAKRVTIVERRGLAESMWLEEERRTAWRRLPLRTTGQPGNSLY
jgi:hypothetical protein